MNNLKANLNILKKNKMVIGLCSVIGLGVLFTCGLYITNQNKVISSIGDTTLKYKDIKPYLKMEEKSLYELNPEISKEDLDLNMDICREMTITKLENSIILYNKAIEIGAIEDVDSFEDEVKDVFDGFINSFKTVEDYDNYIKEKNYPKEKIYSIIRDEFIYSKIYTYYMNQITLSEDEIFEYFKEYITTVEESYEYEEIKNIMEMNIKNQKAYEMIEKNLKEWRAEFDLNN